MQKVWFTLLVIAVIAAVVGYFTALQPYYVKAIAALKDTTGASWGPMKTIGVYGALVLAVVVVSFILRFIAHPVGCKVKKERACTVGREFLLFLWTALIVGVSAIVACYFLDLYRVKDLINNVLTFDFASFGKTAWAVFAGLVALVVLFILLIVGGFKTKANERARVREAKALEEAVKAEEEAKVAEEQAAQVPTGTFFPLIVNGQVQMVPVPTLGQAQPQTITPVKEEVKVEEEPKVEEKPKKEKKVKEPKVKVNCPVRKTQKAWWIVLVVVAVLAAVALYFVPNTKAIITEAYAALTDFDGSSWGRISKIGVYGVLVLAVLFLAFVWRTLVHPISCKAKKNMHCCHGCEFISYVWTVVVIGLIAIAVLYYFDLYLVKHYVGRVLNVVRDVVTFDFASFTKKRWIVFVGLIVAVIAAIWFIVGSIKHKVECKKLARYEAEEAELNEIAPVQQPQMNAPYAMPPMMYPMQQPVIIYQQPMNGMYNAPQYNTGVYEDLNSPYNQYRINDEPRGRRASKHHGKHRFLKFVFVVAVLAVAYVALAYFIKGLPGDDTIRNLVNRFIEIIK